MAGRDVQWFSVRCVFRWALWAEAPYEERITLWRADSVDHAIELAEKEAVAYAREDGVEYLGLAQAYALDLRMDLGSGAEVFSMLRDSELSADDYLTTFFDTGREHQGSRFAVPSGKSGKRQEGGRMAQSTTRSLAERRAAAEQRLRTETNLWLATSSDGRGPHLIPVSYWWDGSALVTATFGTSRTLKNVQAQPKVRVSIGGTGDVLMIDANAVIVAADDIGDAAADGYARASGVPRSTPGFVYVRLVPERMQVWRGQAEFAGRTVMRDGVWLDEPVD